jgi:Flp pilus assembly protein TadG
MTSGQSKNREKGASLFVAIAALVWIILPMLGLFIDLGILYSAKARLQSAVDGAALAAARALNLGQDTSAQSTSAKQNAVNWFYANFPPGNWNTSGTLMNTGTVTVANSPNQANLRQVTVTASTNVPAWFMRWLGFGSTALTVTGQASRRDVVSMLVLDRSGSMCSINGVLQSQPCGEGDGTACDAMITAAKIFTGAFAAGRDQIGMVTFSDGSYLDLKPETDFQTKLGYTNASGNANGFIDNIQCGGGTGTAQAVSLAYNELYKLAEPGAMNFIMLETDGLPNTLVYNYYSSPGTTATLGLNSGSGCKDVNGKTIAQGGWTTSASVPSWSPGISMNTGGTGYMADIPAGAIGAFYTADPAQKAQDGPYSIVLFNPSQTGDSSYPNSIYVPITPASAAGAGCVFSNPGDQETNYSDFHWLPSQDVFGNQVAPANEYQSLTLTGNENVLNGPTNGGGFYQSNDWTATHAAALNATDNSAYNARANATLPAYLFVIGLGGNAGTPPDPILLQRMANDPNGDQFNNPAVYPACSSEPTCISYASQPQGQFIYSPSPSQLAQAFLQIASQVLRLSR